jgi:hypothetical protein
MSAPVTGAPVPTANAQGTKFRVNKLDTPRRFSLMTLVRAEYTTSGMDDAQFARYAQEKLAAEWPGLSLTREHIEGARRAQRVNGEPIPNNHPHPGHPSVRAANALALADTIEGLAGTVQEMDARVGNQGLALARMQQELDDMTAKVVALITTLTGNPSLGAKWRIHFERAYTQQQGAVQ